MSAPKGNQFWKLRSKHGRELLFQTPDLLWEAATEYFQWVDKHPWKKIEQAKGNARPVYDKKKEEYVFPEQIVKLPTERPYTLSGLCIYLDASESYWRNFRKLESLSDDFLSVIHRIEQIIATQQFEGAAVGSFNANIIARKQGLTEKVESENKNYNINSVEVTEDDIRKFRKALEDDI
jgi:meiotically up-regulated gene 157 (Mug157) protein